MTDSQERILFRLLATMAQHQLLVGLGVQHMLPNSLAILKLKNNLAFHEGAIAALAAQLTGEE